MKRKPFALSWGRKMFFGMGWALTSLVALNYFRSMIIPATFGGWFYYLLTYVGHYGMILSLVYFLLFVPVISIFPSYYVSRIWSVFLILIMNVLIFLDGHLFAKYRFHLNSFLFDLLREGNGKDVVGLSSAGWTGVGIVAFVAFLVLWIRGEWIWRAMQARFSNPVKNWYLAVIFLCFVGSHLFHMYGDAKGAKNITKVSSLFPMNFPLTSKGFLRSRGLVSEEPTKNQGYKDFYYPAADLSCAKTEPSNIVFVLLEGWSTEDFNGISMPKVWHIAGHGHTFTNHFSGGGNLSEGLFSLFYSLPPAYLASAMSEDRESVFFKQLKGSGYVSHNIDTSASPSTLKQYLPGNSLNLDELSELLSAKKAEAKPFLLNVVLGKSMSLEERDAQIQKITDTIQSKHLADSTIIVITGTHGVKPEDSKQLTVPELKTPLVVLWPDQEPSVVQHYTSHYDIIPTLVREDWKCKNRLTDYSFGHSLFSKDTRSLHVAGDYRQLGIIDFDLKSLTTIGQYEGLKVVDFELKPVPKDKVNEARVLNMLEKLTYFFRKH